MALPKVHAPSPILGLSVRAFSAPSAPRLVDKKDAQKAGQSNAGITGEKGDANYKPEDQNVVQGAIGEVSAWFSEKGATVPLDGMAL